MQIHAPWVSARRMRAHSLTAGRVGVFLRRMARPTKYVVVYDVTDDAERTRVAKVVEGFGVRVQKSAFECVLTRGARATLERRLGELQLKTGFVFLYRRDARAKRIAIGAVPPNPFDEANYAFVVCAAGDSPRAAPAEPNSTASPAGAQSSGSRDNQSV